MLDRCWIYRPETLASVGYAGSAAFFANFVLCGEILKMEVIEIITYLRNKNFTVKTDGQNLDIAPAAKVTNELIERLRKHKPAIIAELQREERRLKVLGILEDNLDTQRAFVVDVEADAKHVIVTIAIRDQYTFEMIIPREKYDAFLLMELIEKAQIQ